MRCYDRFAFVRAIAIVAFVVSVASASTAAAQVQECTASRGSGCTLAITSVQFTLPGVVVLSVNTNNGISADSLLFAAPTDAAFAQGFSSHTGPTITVRANRPWQLNIQGNATTWTATQTSPGVTPRANKPVGDLTWSTGGAFTALTASPVSLATGATATAGTAVATTMRVNWAWALDAPGRYVLGVTYTLTAP